MLVGWVRGQLAAVYIALPSAHCDLDAIFIVLRLVALFGLIV